MTEPQQELETRAEPLSAASAAPQPTPSVAVNPDDLHDLFGGSPSLEGLVDEDPLAELRKDPNYAALIGELEYIAAQARMLFTPSQEPSDGLWAKIKDHLPTQAEQI